MITIKGTTKRGHEMTIRARYHEGVYLDEVYNKPSTAKERAWEECREMCRTECGRAFHICAHNTFGFSVAWRVSDGWRIETPQNSYFIIDADLC